MIISKKAYSRTQPLIQKTCDDAKIERQELLPSWLTNYAQNIEKVSVQPYRQEEGSLFDQISSIMNGARKSSKYSSVEEAVRDMKERSGLTAYKNKEAAQAKGIIDRNKLADLAALAQMINKAAEEETKIVIFQMKPQIQSTFDNFIDSTNGNLPIPSVLEKVRSIHKNDIADEMHWDDEKLMHYINEKSIEAKKKHPDSKEDNANLGRVVHLSEDDVDASNMDMFSALNPASVGK